MARAWKEQTSLASRPSYINLCPTRNFPAEGGDGTVNESGRVDRPRTRTGERVGAAGVRRRTRPTERLARLGRALVHER